MDSIIALARQYPVHALATIPVLGLGSFVVLRFVYQTAYVLSQIFLLNGTNLKKFGAKQGAWAVVTGATDGIGKEFALQLAKSSFNVFLVSRNPELLKATAQEIETKYPGTKTRVHAVDFAKAGEDAYASLAAALKDVNVGVLVNNVGKSHQFPTDFVETPLDEINDIIAINVNATLRVTYTILPGMIQRKRGLILNVGSFSGAFPSPMLATYSSSKAFLGTFTTALAAEVKPFNVVVEHLNTYFVTSKLSKIRKSTVLIPHPNQYVEAVLSKVGLACGAAFSGRPNTSTPYWSHALLDYVLTALGKRTMAISYTHALHKSIRKRALAKAERERKKGE